jgi:Kef-type K+ transport system membrane component KefB
MDKTDGWSAPLLVLFFVISGAELDLSVITKPVVLVVGLIYIASRSIGKIFGAYSSAAAMKCEKNIKNYLGFTLLPQAGVALGMCLTASVLPDGVLIRNVVLFAVLVYELVGPMITKISLIKAGDITGEATNARAVKPEKVSKHAHR